VKLISRYPKYTDAKDPKVSFIIDIKGGENDVNVKKAISQLE
jgi:hypothetical protein